jgi:hypothetical protein
VNDRLGIAVCVKGVAEFFEFVAKLAVVVYLAVKNYPGSAILIVNGLLSALQVNDRQPPHAQTNRALEVEAVLVWSAVAYGGAHFADQCLVNI